MNLAHLSDQEIKETLILKERLELLKKQQGCQETFLEFIDHMWPEFICGRHHKIFAEKLEDVANGKCNRLIINMPPRHTKSEFCSTYFPAWIMGKQPRRKIMQTTHTGELAVRFGRKVRNMMDAEEYKQIFPKVELRADSKSAGRWETDKGGEYFAAGVGGAITGRGADLLIIDDPHSEQDALSPTAMENCYEWYTSGPRQRLQPGGRIVVVMTRWSTKDLTAEVLKKQTEANSDQWEVVEFPAIFDDGKVLWPNFWSEDELLKVKSSLPVAKWNAQWLQKPTSAEGAIIKREWWKMWEEDEPPTCEYVLQSYDTAFLKSETADYSAISTWGVFYKNEDSGPSLILLDCKKGRWEFPDLKRIAMESFSEHNPDVVLIEAKASGLPLTQELRNMGIPVINFTPGGRRSGQDKVSRVHACAPMFESGLVWRPDFQWAEEMLEECASFPFGDNDDLVDSMSQAILRFREGGFIRHPSDEDWDEDIPRRKEYY